MRSQGGFRLLVPRPYLRRIRLGDPTDPLLLQVAPQSRECVSLPGFLDDPVGDGDAQCAPGLLWKYAGRILMVATGACAVHCRYCFRRHYPYEDLPPQRQKWAETLEFLRRHPDVHELILSGGDPLMIDDRSLGELVELLATVPHLRRLRIHSRLPVMIPQRVTGALLQLLRGQRFASIVVVHVNHPAEIDADVAAALGRLVDAGIPVLNQAVLLRGVNDSADVLAALCERLVDLRVMPYYLHQLDRVAGAAHFEVPEPEGHALVAELRRRLPGYAVPRYVRETAGGEHKEVIA